MAEGGDQVFGSLIKQVENCSPCLRKGDSKTADKFCVQCNAFFCRDCSKQHDALLNDHPIKEIGSETVRAAIALPKEICQKHMKIVDLYCQHHDTICCSTCMALNHRSCNRVLYIPEATGDLIKADSMDDINRRLNVTIKSLTDVKKQQESKQIELAKRRKGCLDDVDAFYARLLDLLNKLVELSKADIERKYEGIVTAVRRDQQAIADLLTKCVTAEVHIQQSVDNTAQQFIEINKCQELLKTTETATGDARKRLDLNGFDVCVDIMLEKMLVDMDTLVTVKPIHSFNVKNTQKLQIDTSYGCARCTILNDKSVLVADGSNKTLMCLNANMRIINQCSLKESPSDVCCISDDEAVLAQGNILIFVSLRPYLKPTRTLQLKHYCGHIAYSNRELFITGKKSLYVYNLQGDLLRTVTSAPSGEPLFLNTGDVAVSDDGERIYVVDAQKRLVILARDGRQLGTLTISDENAIHGICTDGSGGIFVCGLDTCGIYHMDRKGYVLKKVHNDLAPPVSVAFDAQTMRMYLKEGCIKGIDRKYAVPVEISQCLALKRTCVTHTDTKS